ncbi:quinone oxidoreductase [Thiohalocapsa marina]|uniref:NADPH:quinone reductase n=1 Tax=Thiohalocapsa marina TaxID=424902 RepID=A0A5M8FL67_9GAMM|nr:quinone oxidoreductase [Thiohalocapsa marina]KAA6183175.1 quinone oxidoreductase [Thiohalocapsa marina]
MNHAVRVYQHGEPDVLIWEPVDTTDPGPGEARVRHSAIGLNFIDIYFRRGLYPPPALPFIPGMEAAGIVEAVGDGVTDVAVGDRVAYATAPLGSYAEVRNCPAETLVPLPSGIDASLAAACLLKGMTAEYLVRRTYPVQAGETILVLAAAGGVGQILCQWAAAIGAKVIGVVGSDAKVEIARAHGCAHTIVTSREDMVARVREITAGAGVPVVYDSVGADSFESSLACLQRRGMLVSYGQSSGKVPPLDVGTLAQHGSLYLTRPTLMDYVPTRPELLASANALFEQILQGHIKVDIANRYPLRDAVRAHADIESRLTTGSTLLLP